MSASDARNCSVVRPHRIRAGASWEARHRCEGALDADTAVPVRLEVLNVIVEVCGHKHLETAPALHSNSGVRHPLTVHHQLMLRRTVPLPRRHLQRPFLCFQLTGLRPLYLGDRWDHNTFALVEPSGRSLEATIDRGGESAPSELQLEL